MLIPTHTYKNRTQLKIWSSRTHLRIWSIRTHPIIWSNYPHLKTISGQYSKWKFTKYKQLTIFIRPHIYYEIPEITNNLTWPHLQDINLKVKIWSIHPNAKTLNSQSRPHIQYEIPENANKLTYSQFKDNNLEIKIWANRPHRNPYPHIKELKFEFIMWSFHTHSKTREDPRGSASSH